MEIFKSLIINMAIASVWYVSEWKQFYELQLNRRCDNIISIIYFLLIWYFLEKLKSQEEKYKRIISMLRGEEDDDNETEEC